MIQQGACAASSSLEVHMRRLVAAVGAVLLVVILAGCAEADTIKVAAPTPTCDSHGNLTYTFIFTNTGPKPQQIQGGSNVRGDKGIRGDHGEHGGLKTLAPNGGTYTYTFVIPPNYHGVRYAVSNANSRILPVHRLNHRPRPPW
jgi:hypothetical protein